ncbi:helix-turn-helix transcriptional regulator [Oceanobacter mangrovi]|uniref:helix-turn-helix transcriptional regulator n=1 Tax=Oceanobacter mangrovi TaxID=2862510 RepID=UPI001C8E4BA9|nr:helix-turn-helix transcriptional regulator [Oceanobacter mangrovi]
MDQQAFTLPSDQHLTLLESLGTPAFYDLFLDWLHQQLNTDQCMTFLCPDGDRLTTVISKDFGRDQRARQLALSYISEEHYRNDPNFESIKQCQPGQLMTLPLASYCQKMGRRYRELFISGPGFVDKWSVICHSPDGNYCINLYSRRGQYQDLFGEPGSERETGIARLIAMLVTKHYLLNNQLLNQGPLAPLSERERQVCEAMLAGKKAEAIGHELGVAASSIVTYRKRAYDKLGICSRAQLFALCR